MSNKTTTDTATNTNTTTGNTYSPAAMSNYNQFQGTLGTMLQQYANNPLGSSFFNQQAGMSANNASAINQRNISNVTSNARTGGGLLGNSGSFMQAGINKANLQGSANQSQGWNAALGSALTTRNSALGAMEGYTPLQTGQTSNQNGTGTSTTQQQTGLGSILGSLGGIGLSMAMPGIGSMLGGGGFSDGYGGAGQLGGTGSTPKLGGINF